MTSLGLGVTLGALVVSALAGWAIAGPASLIVVAIAAALIASVVTRMRIPRPRRPQPTPARHRWGSDPAAAYASFAALRSRLGWGHGSRRVFDRVVRPVLQDAAAALLADRHAIDLYRHPGQAAELIGADLWDLVDPERPAAHSDEPIVTDARVDLLLDRLEAL